MFLVYYNILFLTAVVTFDVRRRSMSIHLLKKYERQVIDTRIPKGKIQRGPQPPLAHRPYLQDQACYPSAERMPLWRCDRAVLAMPQIPSRWLSPAFPQAVCLRILAAKVYPFPHFAAGSPFLHSLLRFL